MQPFWVAETWSNFSYFNSLGSDANVHMRPWEALLRDPWWIFTTWRLVDAIKKTYGYSLWALVKINSRFGVMLGCMFVSIAFLLTDVVVNATHDTSLSGINPYWRFALVFKCASDTIFLDDFKSVLDDIIAHKLSDAGGTVHRGSSHTGAATAHTHKHSYSSMRGPPELIECDPLPGPVAAVESPRPAARHRSLNPFGYRGRKKTVPRIHVHNETTVTSEMRALSHDSWASDRGMLRTPEAAVHGLKKGNESQGSLSICVGGSHV